MLLAALALALLAGCTPGDPQSTFGAGGPVARLQEDLFVFIFWIAAFVFVVVQAALIYSVIRFRARRGAGLPAQTHGNNALEIVWTVIPALILIAVAVPTVRGIYTIASPPSDEGNVLEVRVRAHQWWWEIEYVGQNVVTANEIRIPAGRVVNFILESDDVIHSFWVPKLGGKLDVIPNNVNQRWLKADEPGVYMGQCAEFCGEAHAKMGFRVIAQPPAEFDAWLEGMRRPPAPIPAGTDAAEGRSLFAQNCGTCHSTGTWDGEQAQAERAVQDGRREAFLRDGDDSLLVPGPNLTHFGTRGTLAAGWADLNQANLEEWIRDPDDVKIGTRMKQLALPYRQNSLTDSDIRKLAAYLLALKPGESDAAPGAPAAGSPERGQELFSVNCSGCHSTDATQGVGPGLGGVSQRADDAYIRESITDPNAAIAAGFTTPSLMPATFAAIFSDTDIESLVEYLKTLP